MALPWFWWNITTLLWFLFPLSEVVLPILGFDFRRETVCFARSQALMVNRHTRFHMLAGCSIFPSHCWIPERQKSSVIPRVAVYYATVAGTFSLCTDQLRNLAWHPCDAAVGLDWWQLCLCVTLHSGMSTWNWTPSSCRTSKNIWLAHNK